MSEAVSEAAIDKIQKSMEMVEEFKHEVGKMKKEDELTY